jgi:hypothetical protein
MRKWKSKNLQGFPIFLPFYTTGGFCVFLRVILQAEGIPVSCHYTISSLFYNIKSCRRWSLQIKTCVFFFKFSSSRKFEELFMMLNCVALLERQSWCEEYISLFKFCKIGWCLQYHRLRVAFYVRPSNYLWTVKGKVVQVPFYCWAPRHEGVLGEWRYSSMHSWLRHKIEASGQLHTSAALPPGKEPPVPIGYGGGVPEPVWTRWSGEKFPAPTGTRTPEHPARSPALYYWAIPTPAIIQNKNQILFHRYNKTETKFRLWSSMFRKCTNKDSTMEHTLLGSPRRIQGINPETHYTSFNCPIIQP